MIEDPVNYLEQSRQVAMERYRRTPVYFASKSNTKIDLLERAGLFGEIISVADENADLLEKIDHAEYIETPASTTHEDQKDDTPAFIATGKLRSLIASKQIPKEAFALAVDTMAQYFPRPTGFRVVSLERPASPERARENVYRMLKSVTHEYILFRDSLHHHNEYMQQGGRGDELGATTEILWSAHNSIGITIKTGVAIKYPNRDQIRKFSVEIKLFPQALFDIVERVLGNNYETRASKYQKDMDQLMRELEPEIQKIVDELMQIDPDKILSVSGGVDYGDRRVRECLKLRVMKDRVWISEDKVDENWFHGMPTEEIKKFLEESAI